MQINLEFNVIYKELFTTEARYLDLWGGRARGGSHTATDYFLYLITRPEYFRGTFMRAIYGDIRGSLWQDFKDRVDAAEERGDLSAEDFRFNESNMSVEYKPTGNTIISKGFKKSSGSQSAKLKSLAGMTHVIIEECEEVEEDDFNKLDDSLRTVKVEKIQVIRLYNPPHKNHWLIKRFYNLVESGDKGWYRAIPKEIDGFLSIHSTYLDNLSNLNQSTKSKYKEYGNVESAIYNPDFFYRDVKGLVSEGKKGRIITNVYPINYADFRSLPYPSFFGLDFGFSSDPVALTEMKKHNNILFCHETIYEPGLTDDDLAAKMSARGVSKKVLIVADSAEPKSIATLKRKGFNVKEAKKGPDSVRNGIKELQSLKMFITENSANIWKETEEYSWALDSNKEPTDTPVDKFNHAIDSIRYGYTSQIGAKIIISGGGTESILDML